MASVNFKTVRLAFRNKLKKLENLPQCAWENRPVAPEDGKQPGELIPEMLIEEILNPGPQTRMSTGYIECIGTMTYMVKVPAGSGTEKVETFAAQVTNLFEPPTALNFRGYSVKVERAEQMPGANDGQPGQAARWYEVPVHLTFRLFVDCLNS